MTAAVTRISVRLLLCAASLTLLANLPVPAHAQNAGGSGQPQGGQAQGGQQQGKQQEEVKIPAAVLSGLLTGTPEALLTLKQYLASVGASPDEVARRATQIVQQLRDSGLVRDPALILAAAERVTQAVTETLNSAKILQLKIDRNFKPPAGTIALDFAPADAPVHEGFRRVLPSDNIVQGEALQAIRRPGDEDVLADGIAGVEKVSLNMPDGEYRVTLMTEALGDATTTLSPFGQGIVANGQNINVSHATPEHWLKQAVLSNDGLQGFQSASAREGGAMTFTVKVTGGKLDLGFNFGSGAESLKTYLTGMLVEPAAQAPMLTAAPEVQSLLSTPTNVGRYETQVASSIASLLESTAPEAGPQDDLAKPVQTVQQASPS